MKKLIFLATLMMAASAFAIGSLSRGEIYFNDGDSLTDVPMLLSYSTYETFDLGAFLVTDILFISTVNVNAAAGGTPRGTFDYVTFYYRHGESGNLGDYQSVSMEATGDTFAGGAVMQASETFGSWSGINLMANVEIGKTYELEFYFYGYGESGYMGANDPDAKEITMANNAAGSYKVTYTVQDADVIPEPATMGLLGLGAGMIFVLRRRIKR